jgi:hypothetical protein
MTHSPIACCNTAPIAFAAKSHAFYFADKSGRLPMSRSTNITNM